MCSPNVLILQHLLFSVTEPQFRVKPPGVSDVSLFFPSLGISFLVLVCVRAVEACGIIILSLLSMEVNLYW